MTDSELLSLDQILAEIEAVDPESVAQLAAMLLAPEKLSVAGIDERGALPRRDGPGGAAPRRGQGRVTPRRPLAPALDGADPARVRRKTRGFPHRGSGVPRRTLSGAGARNRGAAS